MIKKIIFPIPGRFPTEKASGYQTARMAKEFSAFGIPVTIVSIYQKRSADPQILHWYTDFSGAYTHETLGRFDFFHMKVLVGKLKFYVQQIYFSFLFIKFLRSQVEGLILTRHPWLVYVASLVQVPIFYECHDWFGDKKTVQLALLKHANGIITTNTFIQQEFLKSGFAADKILVAPNAVSREIFDIDLTKEEAVERLPLTKDIKRILLEKKVLLYTGSYTTMGHDKGIEDIFHSLHQLGAEYVFVAVGGSPEDMASYKQLAEKIGVTEKVFLLGRHSQDELAVFQKAADVLLMPFPDKAHYRYYMSPLKSYEYMLGRRPIVVSKLPSLAEVFSPAGVYWCEPDNPESITMAIEAIFADEAQARKVAETTYELGVQQTWKKRAEKIYAFMQSRLAVKKSSDKAKTV